MPNLEMLGCSEAPRLTYHLEKPNGDYLVESEIEKVERDAILREWKRIQHLPAEIGLASHFDGISRMIDNDHLKAWKSVIDDLNHYLISNSFDAKIKIPSLI